MTAGGIRLSDDEAWSAIAAATVGILTTLRADGWPVSLPVWFVVDERTVCLSAPAGTKKVTRVRRDPRASFLVESGERWAELRAVHLTGTVEIVDDEPRQQLIAAAIEAKYAALQSVASEMPQQTRQHYRDRTFLRLVPDPRVLSWDNSRIVLRTP